MTMDAMCKYLTNRGFDVDKEYDRGTKTYLFRVCRNGLTLTRNFAYPAHYNPAARDIVQRDFLASIVEEFNKGEKMINNKINWNVLEVTSMTDTDGSQFRAQLVGAPGGIFVGNLGDVRYELQKVLEGRDFDFSGDPSKRNLPINIADELIKRNPYLEIKLGGRSNGKTLAQWNLYRDMLMDGIRRVPDIKKVIFNDPATIVFWSDGSKTVVECQNDDKFDPEKGLAIAITKKALGNKGKYCNELKKWLPKDDEKNEEANVHTKQWCAYQRLLSAMNDPKATKKDLLIAMEESIGYLGEVVDT